MPAKSLNELIAHAKASRGKLSYGSAGTGTMSNLSGELFKQVTGLSDLVHVPYKGAGPGISDLVSGHIPMMTPNVTGQILQLHRSGKVRILAVNAAERLKAAPEIATAIEQGLPGMIGQLALGLFVPAATPDAIVDRIGDATRAAMADPEFQKILQVSGLEAVPNSDPSKARRFLAEEVARWGPVSPGRRPQGRVRTRRSSGLREPSPRERSISSRSDHLAAWDGSTEGCLADHVRSWHNRTYDLQRDVRS